MTGRLKEEKHSTSHDAILFLIAIHCGFHRVMLVLVKLQATKRKDHLGTRYDRILDVGKVANCVHQFIIVCE